MSPHAYIPPVFKGRPIPRGCRYGEHDGVWIICNLPESDVIHERDPQTVDNLGRD
jgi:hypothetical protein